MAGKQSPHELDSNALEIAQAIWLNGESFKEVAAKYSFSTTTVHSRFKEWLGEKRFDIVDTKRSISNKISGNNDILAEKIAENTYVRNAQVVSTSGIDEAFNDGYLDEKNEQRSNASYNASDILHEVLGFIASDLISKKLRRRMSIGLTSGRGTGFTVLSLVELGNKRPSIVHGCNDISLVSLCGGSHVGSWIRPMFHELDADSSVFKLWQLFGVPQSNLYYMGGSISSGENMTNFLSDNKPKLDLAIVGLGVMNTKHHYYRDERSSQMGAMLEPIKIIKRFQDEKPNLIDRIIEVGHRLYLTGETSDIPQQVKDSVDEINKFVNAESTDRILSAEEIILVAGGAQKVNGLKSMLNGECDNLPINLRDRNITLVTDEWTARKILEAT